MALYFVFKTRSDWKATVVATEWHKIHPLIAVATSEPGGTGKVSLYKNEGDHIVDLTFPHGEDSTSGVCEAIAWHPVSKLLICGWKDGSVTSWCSENGLKEITSPHKGRSVTILSFSSNGERLISGDAHGVWQVWKCDSDTLTPVVSNKDREPFEGSLTHVVFRHSATTKEGKPAGNTDESSDAHKLMIEDEEEMAEYQGGAFSVTKFSEACTWFVGGTSGNIWGLDQDGNSGAIFNVDSQPITALLYHPTKSGIIAMNQACLVSYFILMDESRWVQHSRFKLSFSKAANVNSAQMIWAGPGLLATSAHESMIRVWNIDANENYVIRVEDHPERKTPERLASISFNKKSRILCGGTQSGRCLLWQYNGPDSSVTEDDWILTSKVSVDGCVTDVSWGPTESVLSAVIPDSVVILHGSALKRKLYRNMMVVQQTPETIYYEDFGMKVSHTIQSQIRVKHVDVSGSHIVTRNGSKVELIHVQLNSASSVGVIDVENVAVALHPEKLMVARTERGISSVQFYNLQLQKVSHLSIKAHEGEIVHMVCTNDYLCVVTSKFFVSCWWIGGRAGDEKAHGYPRKVWESTENRTIRSIELNCNGSQVGIISEDANNVASLHICDLEHDRVASFDFGELNRTPTKIFWDQTEHKLFGCEATCLKPKDNETQQHDAGTVEIITFFSSERGIKLQDRFFPSKEYTALVGLSVPDFCFLLREPKERTDMLAFTQVGLKVMRDFEGIDCTDPRVKEALLDFSFNLACGDMDAAYRSVKLIKDENVWTNMAQMCVKTGRLDVAEVCTLPPSSSSSSLAISPNLCRTPFLSHPLLLHTFTTGLPRQHARRQGRSRPA